MTRFLCKLTDGYFKRKEHFFKKTNTPELQSTFSGLPAVSNTVLPIQLSFLVNVWKKTKRSVVSDTVSTKDGDDHVLNKRNRTYRTPMRKSRQKAQNLI